MQSNTQSIVKTNTTNLSTGDEPVFSKDTFIGTLTRITHEEGNFDKTYFTALKEIENVLKENPLTYRELDSMIKYLQHLKDVGRMTPL